MPFLAPALPFIIGGASVASGVGSLLSGRKAANATQQSADAQTRLAAEQAALERQKFDLGKQIFERSQPAYQGAFDYYSNLLRGGPELDRAVGPSANRINLQYNQAIRNAVKNAYTRGGGLDRAIRTMEQGRALSLSDLYNTAPQRGAQGLAELSGTGAGQGLSTLSGANLAGSAATLAAANQAMLQQQQQRAEAFESIGGILTRLLTTPGLLGGSKGHSDAVLGGQIEPPNPVFQ